MGHRETGTICEIIFDRSLTNYLWLKNPSIDLPIETIMSLYSKDLLIDRHVWIKFHRVVSQLEAEGRIVPDDISVLFYDKYVEEVLMALTETDLGNITPDFIIQNIEKANDIWKQKEAATREEALQQIRTKENEYLETLKEQVADVEQQKELERLEEIDNIKARLRHSSQETAKKYMMAMGILIALIILSSAIVLLIFSQWLAFGILAGLLTVIAICIKCIFRKSSEALWGDLEEKLTVRLFFNKLNEAGLEMIGEKVVPDLKASS
jgi:ABC-type multidrug transport system fused ATPase/permease subunit